MKKLTVLVVVFVLGATQLFALGESPINAEGELRDHIAVLLKNPEIKFETEELKANIEFTLNKQGEIVVLSVNAEDEYIKQYVKSRLNYQRVETGVSAVGTKIFRISLKILNGQERK
ncbi:hypothetical protein ABW636_17170 [Aquimarina sp. 2201CG1-2-11]|uniref:hypothetical protein n=1 Tax=Aquimarina discodermiae TaxID=3231043 RepID=UPI003462E0B4